jgi:hypothetical protein
MQSLMFPVLDAKELDRKMAELETVEHWLEANLQMLRLSIQSLAFQKQLLEAGPGGPAPGPAAPAAEGAVPNPAMWAWNLMAQATAPPPAQKAKATPGNPRKPVRKKRASK